MKSITALRAQKRKKDRVNIYLDGEFAFGLALDAAVSLRVGQSLSADQIADLQRRDHFEKARQLAVKFVAYRPRSEAEVRRNLRGKKYPEDVIEEVVGRLKAVDLLDDVAFARYWVEQRETFKPRGRIALQQELRQKGVGREIIEEILDDVDEEASARRAASQQALRWQALSEEEFTAKLGRHLQRRGFGYGLSKQVTQEMWRELAT